MPRPFSIFIAEVIFIVCGFGQSSHCVGGDSSNVREMQLRLRKANPSSPSPRHSANYF